MYLVAWLGPRPVGHANLRWGPMYQSVRSELTCPEINALAVLPDVRNRGIGSALIAECERLSSLRGCRQICIGARTDNDAARRLYERAGYRDWGRGDVAVSWLTLDDEGREWMHEEVCDYLVKEI